MHGVCKNCGKEIRTMVFRGGDWCSDYCRKVLLGQIKCSYELIYDENVGEIEVCYIHGHNSKYPPHRGEHRPCLAVEPYVEEEEFEWQ